MKNSVEIMCIDICLTSSNIKRMGRKKRRVIVIMHSSWFKGFLLTPTPLIPFLVVCQLQRTPSRGCSSKISDKLNNAH